MVTIREKQQLLLSSDASVFRQQLSTVLDCMREELDNHRLDINEGTAEMSSMFEFLNELNRKIDRIAERVDSLTLAVQGVQPKGSFVVQKLSEREKDVFRSLYALTETQPYASYEQVARRSMLAKEQVVSVVAALIQKGVPVLKKMDSNQVFLKLDPVFRVVQAKENLVGLQSPLTCYFR